MSRGMATVDLESHSWGHDTRYVQSGVSLPSSRDQPLNVASESTMLPYGSYYGASQLPKMESTPTLEYGNQAYLQASSERRSASRPEYPQVPAQRQRMRSRRRTSLSVAAFVCYQCGEPKSFARHYNYKQHMETHNADRPRPHVCLYEVCDKKFTRKADLVRHIISVHAKRKEYKCDRCPALFARKDTCGR